MNDNWKNLLIGQDKAIYKAIEILDKYGMQIVLIVDYQNHLLGTITDGDIRRGLLKKIDIKSKIEKVMNQSPITVNADAGLDESRSIMSKKGLLQLPIVDSNNKLIGLHTYQEKYSKQDYDNPVLIMAGGFGKRLRPLTDNVPKPMLQIGNKPILENIILNFMNNGFNNIFISTHYLSDQIKDYFKDGSKWNINIKYLEENIPLGTAGALSLLPDNINMPTIVVNGDVVTKLNIDQLLKSHLKHNADITMGVKEFIYQVPYGVIESEGIDILQIHEKPTNNSFINAGVYVINDTIKKYITKDKEMSMTELINKSIKNKKNIKLFPIHELWIDIGEKDQLLKANIEIDSQ
tara:strand:+ start:3772 stop:4818 length:1047 start_codon:yes stop_codon:yes gene_type:complete